MPENHLDRAVATKSVTSARCENCHHWGGLAAASGDGSRFCTNPGLQLVCSASDCPLPASNAAALVCDDIGVLQTGPDFGCNQWLPKIGRAEDSAVRVAERVAMAVNKKSQM